MIEPRVNVKRDPKYDGMLNKLAHNIKAGGVEVGVLSGMGEHPNADNATVAEVAAWNEFGTNRTPQRSFIRSTLRLNRLQYRAFIRKMTKLALRRKTTTEKSSKLLGLMAQRDVQNTIKVLSRPANSAETIARKKSSNPLIDTGFLRQSISWAIVKAVRGTS